MKKSIIKNLNIENAAIAEETKQIRVSAQITVPPDGGWGWVVVIASFFISAISDGVIVTFGCIYSKILQDLDLSPSLVSLVNSVTVACSFCFGPVVSALINRFGFRICVMIGSAITASACFLTFIFGDYSSLLFFYGLISGLGFSMINMGCLLIVGFYFQKWRAMAFTIAVTGSSVGVIFFSLLYTETSRKIGWQYTILLQASVTGLCYFLAFAYRPLLSMTVVQTTILKTENIDGPSQEKKVSIVSKSLSKIQLKPSESLKPVSGDEEETIAKTFLTETNVQFPTAAEVIHELAEEALANTSIPDLASSSDYVSRLTLIPNNIPFHDHDFDEIKSLLVAAISRPNLREGDTTIDAAKSAIDIYVVPHEDEETDEDGPAEMRPKESVMRGVFHWEEHVPESRPLYRDDAFLPNTAKSDNEEEAENPIEYQLKVSRVATAGDLQESRGIFTTAFKRVLATMLDPKFLKRKSFISLCLSMFSFYSGFLIPIIFVTDRGEQFGISLEMRMWFISAVGFSGIFGRFVVTVLVAYISPIKIVIASHLLAGVSTVASCYLPLAGYQIGYCLIFGLTTAGSTIMRSLIIVKLYGLENLTNCTGMVFLFQGLGCLISPPLAGGLIHLHDDAPFAYAGACLILSALLIIPVSKLVDSENKNTGTAADTKPENQDITKDEKADIIQEEPMNLTELVENLQTETKNPGT